MELKKYNVKSIAQDEQTSIVWGMPGSAHRAGLIDFVLPLERIPDRIESLLKR